MGGGWGGRLFEAGRLLTFPAFRMGAYSRWVINTIISQILDGRDCKYCKINYQFFFALSELENFYDGFKE